MFQNCNNLQHDIVVIFKILFTNLHSSKIKRIQNKPKLPFKNLNNRKFHEEFFHAFHP